MQDWDAQLELSSDLIPAALEALEIAAEGEAPPVSLLADGHNLPVVDDTLFFSYDDGTTVDLENGEIDDCMSESEAGSRGSSMSGFESDSEQDSGFDSEDDCQCGE